MTVKERILIIRLSEKIEKQPEYANNIGVELTEKLKVARRTNDGASSK